MRRNLLKIIIKGLTIRKIKNWFKNIKIINFLILWNFINFFSFPYLLILYYLLIKHINSYLLVIKDII